MRLNYFAATAARIGAAAARIGAAVGLITTLIGTIGCRSGVSNPTWTDDIGPLLAANCVRCHGRQPRGGAPLNFRLDVYDDGIYDGDYRVGAGAMAQFIAERVHAETMPPTTPLADFQIDTLQAWWDQAGGVGMLAARGDANPGNTLPNIQIDDIVGEPSDNQRRFNYVISDREFHVVTGSLFATPVGGDQSILLSSDLHSGAGTARWFVGNLPPGSYETTVALSDGHGTRQFSLPRVRVTHPDDNTLPTLTIESPAPDDLLSASPLAVSFTLTDPDPGDTTQVIVSLSRGQQNVVIASTNRLGSGQHTIDVDTTVAQGPGWTLAVQAGPSTAQVSGLYFSKQTSSLRYADVAQLFAAKCGRCHPGSAQVILPTLGRNFADYTNIARSAGLIYRRVVQEQTMPPRSAETILDDFTPMTTAERAMIGEWLLAGAPEN